MLAGIESCLENAMTYYTQYRHPPPSATTDPNQPQNQNHQNNQNNYIQAHLMLVGA